MDGEELGDRLQLHDHDVVDEKVDPVSELDLDALVHDRQH